MDPWCGQFRAEGQERTETKISKKTVDQSLTIGWTKVKVLISSLKAKQNGGKFDGDESIDHQEMMTEMESSSHQGKNDGKIPN